MIIVLETTAVLLLVCSALLFHLLRQSRRDHRIIRDFVDAVHLDLGSRQQSLVDILERRFRTGGEATNTAIDELVAMEREVYRTMVNAYHHRDGISLLKVHTGLKKVLWASLELVPTPHEFGTAENQMRFLQLQRELAIAEEQKSELQEKIRNNDQEMRTLLAEYQRIFSKQQSESAAVKQTA
jgi:hypothetical protein